MTVTGMKFQKAFFIKLGERGKWEEDSLKRRYLRLGWKQIPLKWITEGKWPQIKKRVRDWRSLRRISQSATEDVWITFHKNQLWWCHLANSGVREDKISKYRKLKGKWSNKSLIGALLTLDQIPGTIEKIRGYRATCCKIRELETLRHLLLGEASEDYKNLERALVQTERAVANSIKALHWKDFETLIDLVLSHGLDGVGALVWAQR